MRINFEQTLCNFDNVPLNMDGEIITLKKAVIAALLANYPNESISGDEKFTRYDLAKRTMAGNEILTDSELAQVKTLLGKFFTTLVVGSAYEKLTAPTEGLEP